MTELLQNFFPKDHRKLYLWDHGTFPVRTLGPLDLDKMLPLLQRRGWNAKFPGERMENIDPGDGSILLLAHANDPEWGCFPHWLKKRDAGCPGVDVVIRIGSHPSGETHSPESVQQSGWNLIEVQHPELLNTEPALDALLGLGPWDAQKIARQQWSCLKPEVVRLFRPDTFNEVEAMLWLLFQVPWKDGTQDHKTALRVDLATASTLADLYRKYLPLDWENRLGRGENLQESYFSGMPKDELLQAIRAVLAKGSGVEDLRALDSIIRP